MALRSEEVKIQSKDRRGRPALALHEKKNNIFNTCVSQETADKLLNTCTRLHVDVSNYIRGLIEREVDQQ